MKIFPQKIKFLAFLLVITLILGAFATVAFAAELPSAEFLDAVDNIRNSASLSQKERFVAVAGEKWQAYVDAGGSSDDAEVSEAYVYYLSSKGEVDRLTAICIGFIEDVISAAEAWSIVDYKAAKDSLSEAEAAASLVDRTYEGVSSAMNTYSSLLSEISTCEKPYLLYIENIEKAAASVTYEEAYGYLEIAEMALRDIKKQSVKIADFPGFADAEAASLEVEEFLNDVMSVAVEFLDAVKSISPSTIKTDVAAAYEIYGRIDVTAAGVKAAKRELDGRVKEFNDNTERSNGMVDDANSMIFSLIF